MPRSRRRFLAATGTVLCVTAGCLDDEDGTSPASEPSTDTETGRDDTTESDDNEESVAYDVFLRRSVPVRALSGGADHRLVTAERIVNGSAEAEELLFSEDVVPVAANDDREKWLSEIWLGEAVLLYATLYVPASVDHTIDIAEISVTGSSLTAQLDVSGTGDRMVGEQEPAESESLVEGIGVLIPVRAADLPEEATVSVRTHRSRDWFDVDDALIDPESLSGRVAPDTGPVALPEGDACPSVDTAPQTDPTDVAWGTTRTKDGIQSWAMRLDEPDDSTLAFERGDEVTITLTNTSYSTLTTGSKSLGELQVLTTDGWHALAASLLVTGPALMATPGTHFQWTVELTPGGIAEALDIDFEPDGDDSEGDTLVLDAGAVCKDLPVGRYRFVYPVGERSLAVAFDYLG